jgi:dynein heavy chain
LFKLEEEEKTTAVNNQNTKFFEDTFQKWINNISNYLNDDSDSRKDQADAGPTSELDYWRGRMQKITNWSE